MCPSHYPVGFHPLSNALPGTLERGYQSDTWSAGQEISEEHLSTLNSRGDSKMKFHFLKSTAMGIKQKQKRTNFRRSFLWEARYGSKKPTNVPFFFCRWPQEKTQTYKTVHAFRSTIQNLPPRTKCAQGGPNISNFEDEMCPRWGSFSN